MRDDPLLRCFDRLLARSPSTVLVASPDGVCTRADLDARARAASQALAGGAPAAGIAVGLQAPGGPAFLAGLLALLRSGHPAVLLDSRLPGDARRTLARGLGFSACLITSAPWAAGPGDWRLERLAPEAEEMAGPPPPGTAVIKVTSGSSGQARGVATPSEALLADDAALTASMGIRDEDRLLAAIPLSHSYGLSSLAVPALARGVILVVPGEAAPLAPMAAAAACAATVFPTVPAYITALVRLAEPAPVPPSLRLILAAGAPLAADSAARFRDRHGRPVHVFYGASECGGICFDRDGTAAESGTVGEAVDGVRIELTPSAGAPPGTGRVVVGSPAVASCYWPAPSGELEGGRFASQDLGRWQGERLALSGRLDAVINVRGRKVHPAEVERVLAALAPVEEASVYGLAHAGGTSETVHAVVACPAGSLSVEQVLAWCRDHLSDYKVPRSIRLVRRLPRTERGKLDRAALRAPRP